MAIKRILATIDAADPSVVALETSLLLARHHSAQVVVLNVASHLSQHMPPVGEGMSEESLTAAFREAQRAIQDLHERARGLFSEACRRQGIPVLPDSPATESPAAIWVNVPGQEDGVIARRGRLADLVVMARAGVESRPPIASALNETLTGTGRPVLVAGSSTPLDSPKTVAIAWNGSLEAARAVAGAFPFLRQAKRILVFTGESTRTRADRADELRNYLSLHHLAAEIRVFPKTAERSVPIALLEECAEERADLLVMGAFAHSRLRELVLGGVTRHVLQNATLPILMAR